MAKEIKKVVDEPTEYSTELKNTFFDTFQFAEKTTPPVKTEEEIAAEAKIKEDEDAAAKLKEEANKGKTPEEIKAEEDAELARIAEEEKTKPPVQTPEEVQTELQVAFDELKEKKEEDLDDDEKQFIDDFEAGNLKDYIPPVEKPAEEPKEVGYDTLTKDLIKDGVLVDVEELEDTQESFSGAINKTVEAKVEEWISDIPDDYKNVLDHLRSGGDINTYLQNKQRIDYGNLDYKNEQVQIAIVRADLEQQGHTAEEVAEKLTDLKDLEKLEKEAVRAGKVFDVQQTKRIEEYDQSIQDALTAQDTKDQKEVDDLAEAIDKTEDVVGFKMTKKRREAFKKFLFDVDEAGETAASKASSSIEDRIKLYFMSFINYDFTDLQKSVTTKKTRDLSKFLTRFKDTQTVPAGKVVEEVPPEPTEQPLVFPSIFDRPIVED